jgi:hypothetical protein
MNILFKLRLVVLAVVLVVTSIVMIGVVAPEFVSANPVAVPAVAPTPSAPPATPPPPKEDKGVLRLQNPIKSKNINDIIVNVITTTLGIVGALALLAFVVGGVTWLTSAGSPEKVQTGTRTMLYATIGIVVIFTAYAVLSLVLTRLSAPPPTPEKKAAVESQNSIHIAVLSIRTEIV